MTYRICVVLDHLLYLYERPPGLPLTGANLSTAALLRAVVNDPDVERLEIFLPPVVLAHGELVAQALGQFVPEDRLGVVMVASTFNIPEVFSDGAPRVFLCLDLADFAKARYLRDRFARGPMPIHCDTHGIDCQLHVPALRQALAIDGRDYGSNDVVTALSESNRTAIEHIILLTMKARNSAPTVVVVRRWVDCQVFKPASVGAQRDARRRWGLPVDGRIVLYFGRINAHCKADPLPLLRAFAAVRRDGDLLVFAGPCYPEAMADMILAYAKECGLEGDVRIIGARSGIDPADRPSVYAAADLVVVLGDSITEGLGNVVLEAMASGLPVIAADWNGYRDLVMEDGNSSGDAVTGKLVPTWWLGATRDLGELSPIAMRNGDCIALGTQVVLDEAALAKGLLHYLRGVMAAAEHGSNGRDRAKYFDRHSIMMQRKGLWGLALKRAEGCTYSGLAGEGPFYYTDWFSHYATHRDLATTEVRGRGACQLMVHPELAPLLSAELFDRLGRALNRDRDEQWWSLPKVLAELEAAGCARASVLLHLGALCHSGGAELREVSIAAALRADDPAKPVV